jgi:hypothetical protein
LLVAPSGVSGGLSELAEALKVAPLGACRLHDTPLDRIPGAALPIEASEDPWRDPRPFLRRRPCEALKDARIVPKDPRLLEPVAVEDQKQVGAGLLEGHLRHTWIAEKRGGVE